VRLLLGPLAASWLLGINAEVAVVKKVDSGDYFPLATCTKASWSRMKADAKSEKWSCTNGAVTCTYFSDEKCSVEIGITNEPSFSCDSLPAVYVIEVYTDSSCSRSQFDGHIVKEAGVCENTGKGGSNKYECTADLSVKRTGWLSENCHESCSGTGSSRKCTSALPFDVKPATDCQDQSGQHVKMYCVAGSEATASHAKDVQPGMLMTLLISASSLFLMFS